MSKVIKGTLAALAAAALAAMDVETDQVTHDEQIVAARENVNAFIEFCFRDEYDAAFKQAAHHAEWQAIFDHHDRVALLGHAEGGKTMQVAFRLIFELGLNPNLRCYIMSAQEESAAKILGVVKTAIEENERVRMVFPHLVPGKVWTGTKLLVAGRKRGTSVKDFSLQAYGYGSRFLGIRADIIVVDDINDAENSRTPLMRDRVVQWFDLKVQTRLVRTGRVWVLGNAWHKEDLIHQLAARPGFFFKRYSVLTDDGLRATWPAQFPLSRIAKLRGNMPPLSFARAYLCLAIDDETQRFDEAWFEAAKLKGLGLPYAPPEPPPVLDSWGKPIPGEAWQVYTAIDLASGKAGRQRATDTTAIVTIAYNPRNAMQRVLDIRVGRWKSPDIVAQMRDLHDKYNPVFVVEDNGNQQLFVDSFDLVGLRVAGLTTGTDKWDPVLGVEGMAITFNAGKWILPSEKNADGDLVSVDPIETLLQHLLHFTPAEHTDDDVMALWISTKAARTFSRGYWAIVPRVGRN